MLRKTIDLTQLASADQSGMTNYNDLFLILSIILVVLKFLKKNYYGLSIRQKSGSKENPRIKEG